MNKIKYILDMTGIKAADSVVSDMENALRSSSVAVKIFFIISYLNDPPTRGEMLCKT